MARDSAEKVAMTDNSSAISVDIDSSTGDFADAVTFSLKQLGLSQVILKEEQSSAIRAIYEGQDVFVCLPTGYGKSLCFHTLPFVMDHKLSRAGQRATAVLVISPLIALMEDQVSGLKKRGVKASIITSTNSTSVTKENISTSKSLATDSLFFCAPEALVTSKWRDILGSSFSDRIVAVVVDEAHCVSKWYTFC